MGRACREGGVALCRLNAGSSRVCVCDDTVTMMGCGCVCEDCLVSVSQHHLWFSEDAWGQTCAQKMSQVTQITEQANDGEQQRGKSARVIPQNKLTLLTQEPCMCARVVVCVCVCAGGLWSVNDAWTPGRACDCWCGLRWVRMYHQGWKHTDLIVLEMGLLGWGTGETERSKVDAPVQPTVLGLGRLYFS